MTTNQHIIDDVEPDAYMLPSDLAIFATKELAGTAYSVPVSTPDEKSEAMYRKSKVELLTQPLRQELAETQAIVKGIQALIDLKILKYDSDMEGADWDDFIRAEWAAGAMRQLKKEITFSKDYSALESAIEPYRLDAERLDFMIFTSAKVCHANDAEFCWVLFCGEEDIEVTENFDSAREAIDAAIARKG